MEIATVDIHGKPYVATVYYVTHRDLTCFFLAKTDTQKAINLTVNPAIAGVVTDAERTVSLQLRGVAEDITLTKEAPKITSDLAEILRQKALWPSPAAKMDSGEYQLFAIHPQHIRLADFSKPYSGNDDDFFEIAL